MSVVQDVFDDPRHLPRSPSRAGHRPTLQLQRTHASYNIHLDLPPIQTADLPPLDGDAVSSASSSDSEDDVKVDLAPLCPPSPPSPASPLSESPSSVWSSSYDSEDEWDRRGDLSPASLPSPPALGTVTTASSSSSLDTPESDSPPPWPPTPQFRPEALYEARQCAHYGWSNSALSDLKAMLWHRRQWNWWAYDEDVRLCATYAPTPPSSSSSSSSDPDFDDTPTSIYLPAPPTLPRSRLTPWLSANGRVLPPPHHMRAFPPLLSVPAPRPAMPLERLQRFDPRTAVFPRMGDVADLRDPACERSDRAFLHWPTYGLSKYLFLADMLRRERELRDGPLPPPPSTEPPAESCASASSPLCAPSAAAAAEGSLVDPDTLPAASSANEPENNGLSPGMLLSTRPSETSWRDRWALLMRVFPPPPPPPAEWGTAPHAPAPPEEAPAPIDGEDASPFAYAPPPDDDYAAYPDGDADADAQPSLSESLATGEELAQLVVQLPAPRPVSAAAATPRAPSCSSFQEPPARPPTPFHRPPTPLPAEDAEGRPVVRLPGGAPASTSASHLRVESVEGDDGDAEGAVRFSVAPPAARPGSPRFSFIVGAADDDDTDTDTDAL